MASELIITAKEIYLRNKYLLARCFKTVFEKYGLPVESVDLVSFFDTISNCKEDSKFWNDYAGTVLFSQEFVDQLKTEMSELEKSSYSVNDEKYLSANKNLLFVCSLFSTVTDSDGTQFYYEMVHNTVEYEQSESPSVIYSVNEVIEQEKLDVEENDFIVFCYQSGAFLYTYQGEIYFNTENYQKTISAIKTRIANSKTAVEKLKDKTKAMKIVALILAIILVILSATISNKITRSSFTKSWNNSSSDSDNSDSTSSASSNSAFGGFDEDTVSRLQSTLSDLQNPSSSDLQISSETSSSEPTYKTKVITTKDANGRYTTSSSYMMRAVSGSYSFVDEDVDEQNVAYFLFVRYATFTSDNDLKIEYNIVNDTDYLIRDISLDFKLLTEDGKEIYRYSTERVTDSGNSVSLLAVSSTYLCEFLTISDAQKQKLEQDNGFLKVEYTMSYNVM